MYTIALLAQKGGTGKTTLAVHVAADFEGAGGSAALVDLDPQASAALWGDKRGRSPFVGAVPAARLEAALAAARRSGAGLVVIDTAPHSESAALAAARAADLALVPLRPGLSSDNYSCRRVASFPNVTDRPHKDATASPVKFVSVC